MPASAGRVRMPHNNRMSGSAALNTSAIWKNVIKYDPYAGAEDSAEPEVDEAARLQREGFMDVIKEKARGMGFDSKRGACGKCGNVGHLTYQCRNMLQGNVGLSDEDDDDLSSSDESDANAVSKPAAAVPPATADVGDGERGLKRQRSESSDESRGVSAREKERDESPERKRSKKSKKKHRKHKSHKKDKKKRKEKKSKRD